MSATVAVISAGLSTPSSTRLLADRLTGATVEALAERGVEANPQVIELRPLAVPIAQQMVSGFPDDAVAAAVDTLLGADGVIAVAPVFSGSYSGLFKSFIDLLDRDALEGAPVLIGATGGSERHSLVLDHAMRPLFSYLRALVVPTGVYAASADFGASGLEHRVRLAGSQLAQAMVGASAGSPAPRHAGRTVAGLTDTFADLPDMASLISQPPRYTPADAGGQDSGNSITGRISTDP